VTLAERFDDCQNAHTIDLTPLGGEMHRRLRKLPNRGDEMQNQTGLITATTETSTDPADLAEDVLVRLAQQGNDAAFRELIGRARDACLRLASAILHNSEDAQDEVQNAFWKAYTHIRWFHQQSKFSTWVARIVINHCLMRHRRMRRIRFVAYDAVTPEGEAYIAHHAIEGRTPAQNVGRSELDSVLQFELHRIPPLLRFPLELRYLQDLPLEDVAQRLGISLSATKSRLHRAQGYLRNRMIRHCGVRGAGTLMRVA
jgi:RNA polymerase sigma-70 factor (ECF subfamily)